MKQTTTSGVEEAPEVRALRDGFETAAGLVSAAANGAEAYDRATAVLSAADGIVGAAAVLRAASALRLMREESMSLAQLAERIGTSKSRADQLVRLARERDAG